MTRELSLTVGDLVDVGVQMIVQFGHGAPVKFKIRGRVSIVSDAGVEVRLLDQVPALNGYPLHIPAEAVVALLSKVAAPGR